MVRYCRCILPHKLGLWIKYGCWFGGQLERTIRVGKYLRDCDRYSDVGKRECDIKWSSMAGLGRSIGV